VASSAVRRPWIVAHRGASAEYAEHTLAAFARAIEAGADALECDVRLTADGHLVCVHDRRVDRVSNGRGVVSTKTLDDLQQWDFAVWKDTWDDFEEPPVVDEDLRRVLTLSRLLELVRDAGRPVGLAIETKHPTRYAGLVEQRLVEMLREYGLQRTSHNAMAGSRFPAVQVMSFSEVALRRIRVSAPSIPTVFLMDRVPLRFREGRLPAEAAVAGPSIDILRLHPGYVRRVHDKGGRVHVWTVDDPADIDLCLELGVDALITNRPAETLAHVAAQTGG
jgi:glycerophosphoryl diester phosphodiesterase